MEELAAGRSLDLGPSSATWAEPSPPRSPSATTSVCAQAWPIHNPTSVYSASPLSSPARV